MNDKPLNCVGIDPTKQQTGSHDFRPYSEEPVSLEAAARAASQWVYGAKHSAPRWESLSEEHRKEYYEQAKAVLNAVNVKWK